MTSLWCIHWKPKAHNATCPSATTTNSEQANATINEKKKNFEELEIQWNFIGIQYSWVQISLRPTFYIYSYFKESFSSEYIIHIYIYNIGS